MKLQDMPQQNTASLADIVKAEIADSGLKLAERSSDSIYLYRERLNGLLMRLGRVQVMNIGQSIMHYFVDVRDEHYNKLADKIAGRMKSSGMDVKITYA